MNHPIDPGRKMAIDFDAELRSVNEMGKLFFDEDFIVGEKDYATLYKLLVYFWEHQAEAKWLNLDLSKGLLLTGMDEVYKNDIMLIMHCVTEDAPNFEFSFCKSVPLEYVQSGSEVIDKYCTWAFDPGDRKAGIHCFLELGSETDLDYNNNISSVMGEIIERRYELYEEYGLLTHITTHLTIPEIELRYGPCVVACMSKMFNFVEF